MQGTLGSEGPKRMTPEERMKLLKVTLKKSSRLTENLLRRLDKEWEDVFKEESGTNVGFLRVFEKLLCLSTAPGQNFKLF